MKPVRTPGLASNEGQSNVAKRLTATEIIGGIECRLTLECDASGCYREVGCAPIHRIRVFPAALPRR